MWDKLRDHYKLDNQGAMQRFAEARVFRYKKKRRYVWVSYTPKMLTSHSPMNFQLGTRVGPHVSTERMFQYCVPVAPA